VAADSKKSPRKRGRGKVQIIRELGIEEK